MNDRRYLQIQALQLQQLLDGSEDDPILAPQLKERLDDIHEELKSLGTGEGVLLATEAPPLPRAALFLRGDAVQGSDGIKPSLAGEALIQYEKMYIEQALHDEREAARETGRQRRRKGSAAPGLFFTGTPRGSFGLEFVPQQTDDIAALAVHAKSLGNVADALVRVGSGKFKHDELETIPPRVLQPLKRFLKVLAQHGAELRLALSNGPSNVLEIENIKEAADRLEREVSEEEVTVHGTFRGLTRESVIFDLVADECGLITGTLADSLTEDDLDRIDALTNSRCVAVLQKTTLRQVGASDQSKHLLLDAQPEL